MDNANTENTQAAEEQVLFEADVNMSEKILYDFYIFAFNNKNKPLKWAFNAVFIFAIVGGFIVMFTDFISGLLSVILGIAGFLFKNLIHKLFASREIKSPAKSGLQVYKFYQEYFTETGGFESGKFPYGIVADAYETDKYFYIFISANSACVIPKDAFVFNTPQEMRKLLTIKLGAKFSIKCK